jgi:hypothetical protein
MAAGSFKVPMPKPFSGKAEDWDDFSFKFKAYMVMKKADYVTIFTGAEMSTDVITDQHFIIEGDLKEDLVKLSRELQYMLIHLCEGSSTNLLRQTENSHGAESWRRLRAHYMPSQAMSSIGRLAYLIDFNFSMDNIRNGLAGKPQNVLNPDARKNVNNDAEMAR